MIGELTSLANGPERNVKVVITSTEVRSEISEPPGSYDPQKIERYELSGLQEHEQGLISLALIFADERRVLFYSTYSKFDMFLLLDQLDATIGEQRREVVPISN
jgi:hypothetical protein